MSHTSMQIPSLSLRAQRSNLKFFGIVTVLLLCGLVTNAAASPYAFPVPYVEKDHATTGITFTDLPNSGTIKIINVAGEEVVKLPIESGNIISGWKPVNSSGKRLASGVYFYIVDGDGQQSTGKLVIIR